MQLLNLGRMAVGAALLVAPTASGRPWFGETARNPGTRVALRSLGVRDLVLGAGTYRAIASGQPARSWLQAGVAADAVDGLATVLAGRALPAPVRLGLAVIGGGAAVLGAREAATTPD